MHDVHAAYDGSRPTLTSFIGITATVKEVLTMMGWWYGSDWGPGIHGGFGSAWGIAGIFLTLVFWGGAIALAFLAVRTFLRSQRRARDPYGEGNTRPAAPVDNSALAVLRERYARGEITRAEYEEVRHVLAAEPRRDE